MPPLKVYVDLMSQPARSLILFLKLNKIQHEQKLVAIAKGEHKSEEYMKIHKFGKIPAIDDGGFKLMESVAILRYLARKNNVADHWYPKDLLGQARVDEFLEWYHIGLRVPCAGFFMAKFLTPMLTGQPPVQSQVDLWSGKMEQSLGEVEQIWLKDSPYLTGSKISVADLIGLTEIEQTLLAGYNPSTPERPKLSAWLARLHGDLEPHYSEVHNIFNRVLAKSKPKL